jgi:chitin disaccharide deacetylase
MKVGVIPNANDFGLSPEFNRGIIEVFHHGILTSASLMATGEGFEEAVTLAYECPSLCLGSHLTHIEMSVLPLEKLPSLVAPEEGLFQSLSMFLLPAVKGRMMPPGRDDYAQT